MLIGSDVWWLLQVEGDVRKLSKAKAKLPWNKEGGSRGKVQQQRQRAGPSGTAGKQRP